MTSAPVQVCPRGCYWERARRETTTRTRLSGFADLRVDFRYESVNCPHCGSLLVRKCGRCDGNILLGGRDGTDPDDRCRTCGLPHPWSVERSDNGDRLRSRERTLRDEDGYAYRVHTPARRGELWLVADTITSLPVTAIVSPNDVEGHMWSEAASEIRLAAGGDVQRQALDTAPFTQGKAWRTEAGTLQIDVIVHVAAMDRGGETQLDTALRCIRNALRLAKAEQLGPLAIPALGWGPRDLPEDKWLRAISDEIIAELDDQLEVLLVAPEPKLFSKRAATIDVTGR